MGSAQLARLTKVELHEAWTSEAGSFTPWLARPENISLLGEAVGLDLEVEAQEKDVGPFRADILCKDTTSDAWVLIENQLERTDHSHLGQLLTYAAGLKAVTIIWIAERFTQEHRAALDWLNAITEEGFHFFGLEIELWRIGESPVAPKFNVVCEPNEWSRVIRPDISGHRQRQLQFWTTFKDYMEQNNKVIRCPSAQPQSYMSHPLGRSSIFLASVATNWDARHGQPSKEVRVDLNITGSEAKQHFRALQQQKTEIEREIGCPLEWYDPPNAKKCCIYLARQGDFADMGQWPELHKWLKVTLEKFHAAFAQRVQQLPTTTDQETSAP